MNYSELNPVLNYNKNNKVIPFNPFDNRFNQREDTLSYPMYQKGLSNIKKGQSYYCGGDSGQTIRGMQIQNNKLSNLYFSEENKQRIQKMIKREVFRQTNGVFKLGVDQDDADLLIIMRAVFLEHARHLPNHIVSQVKRLNNLTVEYLLPDLITNMKQYTSYLQNIEAPIIPMDRPINVNRAGRRTLPSVTTTFGIY